MSKRKKGKPRRKLPKRRTSPRQRLALVLLVLLALTAPFLFYVGGRFEIVRTSYEMDSLAARRHRLEQENRALRLQRARLMALPRIEQRARELGLEPVPLDRVVVIRNSRRGDDRAGL